MTEARETLDFLEFHTRVAVVKYVRDIVREARQRGEVASSPEHRAMCLWDSAIAFARGVEVTGQVGLAGEDLVAEYGQVANAEYEPTAEERRMFQYVREAEELRRINVGPGGDPEDLAAAEGELKTAVAALEVTTGMERFGPRARKMVAAQYPDEPGVAVGPGVADPLSATFRYAGLYAELDRQRQSLPKGPVRDDVTRRVGRLKEMTRVSFGEFLFPAAVEHAERVLPPEDVAGAVRQIAADLQDHRAEVRGEGVGGPPYRVAVPGIQQRADNDSVVTMPPPVAAEDLLARFVPTAATLVIAYVGQVHRRATGVEPPPYGDRINRPERWLPVVARGASGHQPFVEAAAETVAAAHTRLGAVQSATAVLSAMPGSPERGPAQTEPVQRVDPSRGEPLTREVNGLRISDPFTPGV